MKSLINLEFQTIFTCLVIKFCFDPKIFVIMFFYLKRIKVALQYLYYAVILCNTVFYLQANYILEINQKTFTY